MRSSWLGLAVSLSLTVLVGCGGGSQMGGGMGEATAKLLRQSPALRKAGISPLGRVCRVLKPLSLCRPPRSWGWHTSNPSVLRSPCPTLLRQLSSFGDHRWTRQLVGQVVSGVWSRAVPEWRTRTRPRICFERKLSLHGRVCGSRSRHVDRSEGQTSHRILYRDHARGREYTSAFLRSLPNPLTSDKDGFFELTGTFTVANTCDETFTLNGASVVGNVVHLYSNTGTGLEGLTGVMDPEAQQIELDDYLYLGDCIAGAHGIVTRQ